MKKMRLKTMVAAAMAGVSIAACAAFTVDFDRIQHWTGEGENRAALVVQFLDDYDSKGYVWGFRWKDGEEPTGETMIRSVAATGKDFCALVQYTGGMGSTLDGVGYSENNVILDYLAYDYAGAASDPYVMFAFDSPNELMGQTKAPGEEAVTLAADAIEAAKETGIIEHPLNAREFGYPAYDYDWWQSAETSADMRWNAGWYTGYWSYWLGGATIPVEEYSYSGLGMSSVKLKDGDVNAWKFMPLNGPVNPDDFVDGVTNASTPWVTDLDYEHFGVSSSEVIEILSRADAETEIYSLDGQRVGTFAKGEKLTLHPGIYIARSAGKSKKIYVR